MADKWKSERDERTTNRESDERVRGRADEYDADEFDDATEDQDEIEETDEEGTTV